MGAQENLKRGVETPEDVSSIHAASGNSLDAAAGESTCPAQQLPRLIFPYRVKHELLETESLGVESGREQEPLAAVSGTNHGENSLHRHFLRKHSRGVSTPRLSASWR